jgi:hypothetical protein
MRKYLFMAVAASLALAAAYAQQQTSVTIESQTVTVKYAAPAAKNRAAGSFHTDADLAFNGFSVPKGDYTLYVLADAAQWQLALNKATGPKAATYDPKLDLGRVPMTMSKPSAPAADCKMTLSRIAALAARLEVTWNNQAASAPFHLDRGANDSEW